MGLPWWRKEERVRLITNILFPVSFSPSCIAMGAYVKRAAALFGARVSLMHVFDPLSHSGVELYVRAPSEIAEEHQEIARNRLDSFLRAEFPASEYPRILVAGDAATEIAKATRNGFDFIIMPTHAGTFRRMLLGSTTAKVLNDADCPIGTSKHADVIAPRPLEHREWLCAIGVGEDSERVLRYAYRASEEARVHLRIIHAIQTSDASLPIQMDLGDQIRFEERERAHERIDELQRIVGSHAPVRIAVGSVKEALLEAARQSDADALIIGRSPQPGSQGRLRDLTYAVVRDSPFPVVSV
jgi:nucleotide-binding universal stress UspA family protein